MEKSAPNPVYALRDGKLVHISAVERGLKCNCICPECNAPLVARKGEKVMHHFAHHTQTDCRCTGESVLHLAAKNLLSQANKMVVPAVFVKFPGSSRYDELIRGPTEILIDHVELEKHFGSLTPDVVVYSKGKFFFVEIFVTHRVDEAKLKKLKTEQISTLEIDLSRSNGNVSPAELSHFLLDDCKEKAWIYNAKAERDYQKFLYASERKPIIRRGHALHVDYCPLHRRIWKGKPYANLIDDCAYCEYHVKTEYEEQLPDPEYGYNIDYKFVHCFGAKGIRNIAEFKQNRR